MFTSRVLALAGVLGLAASTAVWAQQDTYDLGRKATDAEIAGWDIDVPPSGVGLPAGSATAAQGKSVYQSNCAACHGPKGHSTAYPNLVGGQGTLADDKPVKTVGSYWPYATTLYDYIHRAMPVTAPQSISPEQTYAVTAYILYMNGIVGKDQPVGADTLASIRMPNRDGFVSPDPRPDVGNQDCMHDCDQGKGAVEQNKRENDGVPTM